MPTGPGRLPCTPTTACPGGGVGVSGRLGRGQCLALTPEFFPSQVWSGRPLTGPIVLPPLVRGEAVKNKQWLHFSASEGPAVWKTQTETLQWAISVGRGQQSGGVLGVCLDVFGKRGSFLDSEPSSAQQETLIMGLTLDLPKSRHCHRARLLQRPDRLPRWCSDL